MCGITGIWHLNKAPVPIEKISRFNDSLANRGPDGFGISSHLNESLRLGHRRLSILDLSDAGKQPMTSQAGNVTVTYNGEIFNFAEIRKDLELKGYQFKSQTDTEIVLASYQEWGTECFNRFNGMWALAIWDGKERELILCRDRFGIKPLYYTQRAGELFAFGSETRAFKYLDGYKREVDEQLLQMTRKNEYALEGLGYTIFSDLLQILPGHFLKVKLGAVPGLQTRWWSIEESTVIAPFKHEEQIEIFKHLLEDSCKLRLQSDVPLATALSGGLDSTAVYSQVAHLLDKGNIHRSNANSQSAYTAIFPYLKSNEQDYAKRAASFLGRDINSVDSSLTNLAQKLSYETTMADYIGQPITALSSVYKAMRSDGIKVSLDGHGVDEMLYGYRTMVYGLYNNALYSIDHNPRPYADVLLNMYHESDKNAARHRFEGEISDQKRLLSQAKKRIKQIVSNDEYGTDQFIPVKLPPLSDSPYKFENRSYSSRIAYHEFFINTLPSLLRNFDRAGMINGVEIRMPFMDYRLVEFIFSLPLSAKIGEGYTKLILRKAMKNRIDESLRTRTYKVGIGSPVEYWFKNDLKSWMMDMTNEKMRNKIHNAEKSSSLTKEVILDAWSSINLRLITEV